jgi:transcriptional regulator with XRE-family HTH domain
VKPEVLAPAVLAALGKQVHLRAVQAALFRDGLLLHHEPRLARAARKDLRCRLTPNVAATINRAVSTTTAAAAVVHLVDPLARTPWIRLQPWRRDCIEPDGSQLHTQHGPVPVPTCARPILRARLHWTDPTGTADPETNPFAHATSLDDLAAQALRPLRLGGGSELRYRNSRSYPRGHSTAWMHERGLELCPLAELAPREPLPMTSPATFGAELLARARAHGMTGEELASLLGISVPRIRTLPGPQALANHPAGVLHTLAERLDLPWPAWLTAQQQWPDPPPADARQDPARVHAVLAAAFGQRLHLGEIAEVLNWTTDRVRAAADQLATRARPAGGTRLVVAGDTLTLELAPRMLDDAARRRLNQLLHADGLGPDPQVLYLLYQLSDPHTPGRSILHERVPDLVDEALDYQLVIHTTDPEAGTIGGVELHPDVKDSLRMTYYRYPPEDDATTPDPAQDQSH